MFTISQNPIIPKRAWMMVLMPNENNTSYLIWSQIYSLHQTQVDKYKTVNNKQKQDIKVQNTGLVSNCLW